MATRAGDVSGPTGVASTGARPGAGPPSPAPPARTFPHRPAVDGLRALAVVAVIAYHFGSDHAVGGFIGVDVFFVVSGYLITSLLLVEHDTTGGIDLRRFWTRRLRRLAPALLG